MSFNFKNKKVNNICRKLYSGGMVFYLIPFLVLGTWLLIAGKPHVSGYYIIHYLYNYDHGFIPRGLLGEIISWFTEMVSKEMIATLTTIFSGFLVCTTSLCIGKALNKLKHDKYNFNASLVIIVFLCLLPTTFDLQFQAMHLDKIVWVLTFFAIFIVDNRYGIWLVPALCIISTLINPYYVFGSMILIAIILLQKFFTNGYCLKNGIICMVSYLSIISIFIYGVIVQNKINFSSPEEMVDFLFSRYTETLPADVYDDFIKRWLFDYFEPIKEVARLCFKYYFVESGWGRLTIFYFIFISLPLWGVFATLWFKSIKKEKNKFQKFIYFLCLISPVVIIPVELLGWELPRYFTDNLVVQAGLLIYFLVQKQSAVEESLKDIVLFYKKNTVLLVAAMLYLSFVFVL